MIKTGTVLAQQIGAYQITATKIAASSITAGARAANSVTATVIAAGALASKTLIPAGLAHLPAGTTSATVSAVRCRSGCFLLRLYAQAVG